MSIADIVCAGKWPSKGASINTDTAKNKYYPSFPMVFTAKKHGLKIPSANLTYTDLQNPDKRIPISTTPMEMTCVSLKISPAPKPGGAYDFEYAKNLMAATFYEHGDYLVSSPILARAAMPAPQKPGGKKKKAANDESGEGQNMLPPLYVTHVISVFPNRGKYAMYMRSYWSDGTLGSYWCCE